MIYSKYDSRKFPNVFGAMYGLGRSRVDTCDISTAHILPGDTKRSVSSFADASSHELPMKSHTTTMYIGFLVCLGLGKDKNKWMFQRCPAVA